MQAKFTNRALKDLKSIDKVAQKRILKKLKFFFDSPDPLAYAKQLSEFNDGDYRFRIGVYRVVFDANSQIITILRIQHRREVYRKR